MMRQKNPRCTKLLRRPAALLRTLGRRDDGVAFVEFAFGAPLLLVVIMTGLEITNLAVSHMRVSQIAMTVADNSGRVSGSIDEANVYEVFAGADVIGRSLDFEDNGRVVLSSLEPNGLTGGDAGQMVRWQRCWGELEVDPAYALQGAGASNAVLADGLGPDGNRIRSAANTAVMFVEVSYLYQPLVSTGFFDPPVIRYESAFNVRGRENNAITNSQNLTRQTC